MVKSSVRVFNPKIVDLISSHPSACSQAGPQPGCYRSGSVLSCHCEDGTVQRRSFSFFSLKMWYPGISAQKFPLLRAMADIFSLSRMYTWFIIGTVMALSVFSPTDFALCQERLIAAVSGTGIQKGAILQ